MDELLVHSTRPLTVECTRGRLCTPVTPTADMFVRQNLELPDPGILADRDEWTVTVDGAGTLTLAELRTLPTMTRRVVMECAGNGRSALGVDFNGETPWGVGAVACVEWTGVALATVAGGVTGRWCTATGADAHGRAPDPPRRRVERSVPTPKALADGLLAWELNSKPIPLVHGGPLRFVVPGYFAVNSVKFVRRIGFGPSESDADIQRTRYRYRPPGAPESAAYPTAGPLRPKSLVTARRAGTVSGVAWSGEGPVERVEVTVDDGDSWREADLEVVADPAAWRRFSCAVPATAAAVASRATDATGAVQPRVAERNASGYANNGWLGLSLPAGGTRARPAPAG